MQMVPDGSDTNLQLRQNNVTSYVPVFIDFINIEGLSDP